MSDASNSLSATETSDEATADVTLGTWLRFLVGDPGATLQLAASRSALWVGFAFVVSAGIAREYDGEDLLARPYFLAIPAVASFATSLILYGLIRFATRTQLRAADGTESGFRGFLTVYWMLGPLAWFYALPVEQWMSEENALSANLWLLALVASWRITLMASVVVSLFRVSLFQSVCVLAFFIDTLVCVASFNARVPLLHFMGGVRMTPREELLQAAVVGTFFATLIAWPFVAAVFGGVSYGSYFRKNKQPPGTDSTESTVPVMPSNRNRTWQVSRGLWSVAIVLLLVGVPLLVLRQPEQQRRTQVDRLVRSGELRQAFEFMSQHSSNAFPPHYEPPPYTAYGEYEPTPMVCLQAAIQADATGWVRDLAVQKFQRWVQGGRYSIGSTVRRMSDEKFKELMDLVDRFPNSEGERQAYVVRSLWEVEHESERSESTREKYHALQQKYPAR